MQPAYFGVTKTVLPFQYLWILVELDKYSIRTKDPNNHSDTETGTLSQGIALTLIVKHNMFSILQLAVLLLREDIN